MATTFTCRLRLIATCGALASLAACTVGPDYHGPQSASAAQYVPGAAPATLQAAGVTQRIVGADDIRADWWTMFASPRLDALVGDALAASPMLDAARARLVRAQEERGAAGDAVAWPSANLRAGIERQRIDPAAMGLTGVPTPGPFTLYNVGVDVSYAFDVFGGTRRALEGLAADVDYRRYELEAAQRTLAANVVTTALRQASLATQIATLERIAAAQHDTLAIAQKRFDLGAIAEVELASQRALVAQTDARLPPLRAELARTVHRLAVYAGREPATATAPPFMLADFTLPPQIPLTLPSQLAQRRPDVRASAALLHRASADIGVATANLYPQFNFSGNASSSRTRLADIANGINIWSIGLDLAQPLLRGPELAARRRAAIAAFDAAKATYRDSVLHALQDVADTLRALEADSQALAARSEQADAARRASDITRQRYDLGGVSQLALLDAERTRLDAELARDEATAARFADTAALLDALGGGWWEVSR
ncbi:MAG: efflux transporter outer membrane subunit [Betaproteobacteria bacterium]